VALTHPAPPRARAPQTLVVAGDKSIVVVCGSERAAKVAPAGRIIFP